MQLTETRSEGLSRGFKILIPAADLQKQLSDKLAEVQPKVRINGFRPGKVPTSHVKKLYGSSMMQDIINAEVDAATKAALQDGALRVAGQPDLKVESDMAKVFAGEADLALTLDVELIPEFEPADLSAVEIEKPVAPVQDEQIEKVLADLAKTARAFEPKDGPAAEGDRVVIDFVGKIDGEAFEGGSAENATVGIGDNRFIPGFEDGLKGATKGETRTIAVRFPDDYGAEHLKGKEASFEAKVHEVQAPKETVIDDAFAASLGLADLEALRTAIRGQIESEHNAQSRIKSKRQLFDKLDEMHEFELPPGMVRVEFNQIWAQVEQDRKAGRLDEEDAAKSEEDLRSDYEKIARRRVKLGLLLAEIGRRNEVKVPEEDVQKAIIQTARQYPGQERQVFEAYYKNPQLMAQVRAPIYEEKTVDFIFELIKVKTVDVDREALFADSED